MQYNTYKQENMIQPMSISTKLHASTFSITSMTWKIAREHSKVESNNTNGNKKKSTKKLHKGMKWQIAKSKTMKSKFIKKATKCNSTT